MYILSLAIFTSSNLMHVNTYYNISSSQAIYINIVLFAKLNVRQFAFMLHFAKLTGHQTCCVYSMYVCIMYMCMYVYIHVHMYVCTNVVCTCSYFIMVKVITHPWGLYLISKCDTSGWSIYKSETKWMDMLQLLCFMVLEWIKGTPSLCLAWRMILYCWSCATDYV